MKQNVNNKKAVKPSRSKKHKHASTVATLDLLRKQKTRVKSQKNMNKQQTKKAEGVKSIHSSIFEDKSKYTNPIEVNSDVADIPIEKLFLSSTVKITLVEGTTEDAHVEDVSVQYKIVKDKDKFISNLSKLNEELREKLAMKQEILDSQQKVIDDFMNKNRNRSNIDEKLSKELKDKENTSLELEKNQEELEVQLSDAKLGFERSKDSLTCTVAEKEKILNSQQTLIEELLKKLEAVDQKLLQREDNLSLKKADSDSKLEKENEVLVETGKDQSRASVEI